MTSALRRVIQGGTGKRATIRLDAAGKTGTTEDARDAWFVGYTCNLTTAVWMGYAGQADEAVQPMRNILGVKEVTGGSVPATMWSQYMDAATDGVQQCDLTPSAVQYTGTILHPELATTTTTTTPPATTSPTTTEPPRNTTTTSAPGPPPPVSESTTTAPPGSSSDANQTAGTNQTAGATQAAGMAG